MYLEFTAERFQPAQRETRRMAYESRREDIGIGIDAKRKVHFNNFSLFK